jgi:hypothetical protein
MEKIINAYIAYSLLYIYIILYILCLYDKFCKYKGSLIKILGLIICLNLLNIFITLVALRGVNAGNDTPRYVDSFLSIKDIWNAPEIGQVTFGSWEPFFWYLVGIIREITNSGDVFIFSISILIFISSYMTYFLILKSARLLHLIPIAISLLYSTYYLVFAGNAIRQALIAPWILIALWLSYNESYFLAFGIITIAFFFHISSIVGLLAVSLIISFKILNKKFIIWGFIIYLIIIIGLNYILTHPEFLLYKTFIPSEVSNYLYYKMILYLKNKFALENIDNIFQMKTFIFALAMNFFTILGLIFYFRKLSNFHRFTLISSLVMLLIILAFFKLPQIAERLLYYYYLILPLSVVSLIDILNKTKVKFTNYFYLLLVIGIIILYYIQVIFLLKLKSVRYTLNF